MRESCGNNVKNYVCCVKSVTFDSRINTQDAHAKYPRVRWVLIPRHTSEVTPGLRQMRYDAPFGQTDSNPSGLAAEPGRSGA